MSCDVSRFVEPQRAQYEQALAEIRSGHKMSHWIWYIFPQMLGLGHSSMCQIYGIRDLEEAVAFLEDPYLGGNLREITQAVLDLPGDDALELMGWPDNMKLRSCMTLFAQAADDNRLFLDVLAKYFHGEPDERTLRLLEHP